jgi:hypothetical protein
MCGVIHLFPHTSSWRVYLRRGYDFVTSYLAKHKDNFTFTWVRFPAGARNVSFHHCVQNDSGVHPASYSMGTRGSFRGGKAAGA